MSRRADVVPPVIGLSTYREQARWGVWDQPADLLPRGYADAVVAAGGVAVLLPMAAVAQDALAAARAVLARLDGLVISGGSDVDPARYGEEPHPHTRGWRTDRDTWELALLQAAEEGRVPVLGICRGMQLMAVHAGGTLDQHTPDVVGHPGHSGGGDRFGDTHVSVAEGSGLADAVGSDLDVHCHHHQSVREHPGFRPVAHAQDGSLEAMEAPGERFCVGVQWHPEVAADTGLFRALVEAAADHAADSVSRPPRVHS